MSRSIEQIASHCPSCPLWHEHIEDGDKATGIREPNHCALWLCNSGGCPHDRELGLSSAVVIVQNGESHADAP